MDSFTNFNMLYSTVICIICSALLSCQKNTVWKTYGSGPEQEGSDFPYIISYPADFIIEPESDWGDVTTPRDAAVKTTEHHMMMHNPEETLRVVACDYGMVYSVGQPKGMRNIIGCLDEIYFVDVQPLYTLVFTGSKKSNLSIAYYIHSSKNSDCIYFQSLAFYYLKGTSYQEHKQIVDEMVNRFIPVYQRRFDETKKGYDAGLP